ncbi:MAG: hypothetical protein Q8O55_08090 [Dehalococcoidales bacterium]|nr:hypothetical protein [Dehalococcoidales bacterium]
MLLTKKRLNKILQGWRVSIPSELEKELLDEYGNLVADDQGHTFEYTEQDIYQQLRTKLHPYGNKLQGGVTLS